MNSTIKREEFLPGIRFYTFTSMLALKNFVMTGADYIGLYVYLSTQLVQIVFIRKVTYSYYIQSTWGRIKDCRYYLLRRTNNRI